MIDSPLEVTPLDDRILAIALYCFYIFRMTGDNKNEDVTFIPMRVTREQARTFMKEVSKQPTCPSNSYTVTDSSGTRIFFNL